MIRWILLGLKIFYAHIFPQRWALRTARFKEGALDIILDMRRTASEVHDKETLYLYYETIRHADPVAEHDQIRMLLGAAFEFFKEATCQECRKETQT